MNPIGNNLRRANMQVNSKIPTNNQFFGLDVKEHIEDEELVNAATKIFKRPQKLNGRKAGKHLL